LRNGLPLSEPYIKEPPDYTWPTDGTQVEVPPGQIVVMGDNRNNSADSHLWERVTADRHGAEDAPFLPVERVKGSLVYRYWPPDRMGTVAQER
jgi:signal peptidase I